MLTKPKLQAQLDAVPFQHPCKIVPESRGFHVLMTEAELPLFREKVEARSNVVWRVQKTSSFHPASNSNLIQLRQ